MSEYASKLDALDAKKKKLLEEETRLKKNRMLEIAALAERFNLLKAPNELIAVLFAHAENAIDSKDGKAKNWEHEGAKLLKSSKSSKHSKGTRESAAEVS
jgi:hypothetical protein